MGKSIFCFILFVIAVTCNAQNLSKEDNKPESFPIAVWLQSPTNAKAYKNLGINTFVGIWNGINQEKLDLLKKNGLKVICDQNKFGLNHLDEKTIIGWMHGDEPDNAQWNNTTKKYDPCIEPSKIISEYNKIKAKDPSRPVYLNLGRGVAATNWYGRGDCSGNTEMYKVANNGYLKGCDIASFDIYPVNSSETEVKDSLWYVAKGVDNLLEWSDHSKPIWCWIETTRIGEDSERKPTPAEVKSEVWMALIHGASGFGYFCHSFYPSEVEAALLEDTVMANAVKEINDMVTKLAPVLNVETTSDFATVSCDNEKVSIDILTKHFDGKDYLFAVAMQPGKTTATFTITKGKRIEVIGEGRTIEVKGNKFRDDFDDYAVHLYKVAE